MLFSFCKSMKPIRATNQPKSKSRTKSLALLFCMLPNIVFSQKDVVVFHNCENLFHPSNDSLSQDGDFTLEGKKRWTYERYKKKLNLLAKTYIATSEGSFPSIIGLCEIENDKCLNDLCKDTPLRKGNYSFIHYNSDDLRGIDVALLYRPSRFKPIEHYKITFPASNDAERTRDVLYVNGEMNKTKLHLYVVHAPSRREHNAKKMLRKSIFDSIYNHIKQLKEKGEENFIIMGDFNDNPWDSSVTKGFHTDSKQAFLVNLMQNYKHKAGSYVYNGEYLCFDQFIISRPLLEALDSESADYIFRKDFLIEDNPKNKLITPFSTYKGIKYQGGISDHFPIVLKLDFQTNKQ